MSRFTQLLLAVAFSLIAVLPLQAQEIITSLGVLDLPQEIQVYSAENSVFAEHVKKQIQTFSPDEKFTNRMELYQLTGRDKGSIKTALLYVYRLLPEEREKLPQDLLQYPKSVAVQNLLGQYNFAFLNADAMINNKIKTDLHTDAYRVTLADKELIQVMRSGAGNLYYAGTRAFIDLNGFELLYYVQAYLKYTPDEAVIGVVLTSDAERDYFAKAISHSIIAAQ